MMSRTDSDRTTALEHLSTFQRCILPGTLRRIATWKGIAPQLLREWLDDIEQELALDCLENATAIVAMRPRQRHTHWMRCTERFIYRQRRLLSNQSLAVEESAAMTSSYSASPAPDQAIALAAQLPPLVALANGRTNVRASLQKAGMARRTMHQKLNALAEQLGWGEERQRFWQARVAEALTGLAADLLQEQGTVKLLDPSQRAPNPERRITRLRRLRERFPIQPSTSQARTALQPFVRRNQTKQVPARRLLEQAVQLEPTFAPAWLWLFEACCSEQDAPAAQRALRHAQDCAATPRAAIVLGRARLLELRGKLQQGIRLLYRAIRRWPGESTLQRALAVARQGTDSQQLPGCEAQYPDER